MCSVSGRDLREGRTPCSPRKGAAVVVSAADSPPSSPLVSRSAQFYVPREIKTERKQRNH